MRIHRPYKCWQRRKHMQRSHTWGKHIVTPLLLLTLLMLLSGCGANLFPQAQAQSTDRLEEAVTSSYQPSRVLHTCLDTPPLFPSSLFHQAALQIADRIDTLTTVNQAGFVAYLSFIEHDSLETGFMTI